MRWESHWHPIGIMSISSYLDKHGYENYLINTKLTGDVFGLDTAQIEKLVIDKICGLKLDLLGISCAVNEINHVRAFCGKVKASCPHLKIMVGGPMPTTMPDLFLGDETIDFVVRGEGEQIVLNMTRCLERNMDLRSLDGLSYRRNGAPVHNPPQPLIEDMGAIPMPAYEKADMKQYASMHDWVIRGFPVRGVFVLTSRGCPFTCTFCGASTIHGRKVRFRSPESIRDELKFLCDNYGIEGVFFSDDTFTLRRKHVVEICAVMKGLNLVWGCFARVDTVDEDLLKLMKDSGCIQLDFGIESGSDRVLADIIKKRATTAQARKAFALCEKCGMRTFANLMIGLPTETEEEMHRTFALAKELNACAYVLSIAMPLPNTGLWNMVNPLIKAEEYEKLNWHGEDVSITDRCNKSLVSTERLIYLHDHFGKELRKKALKASGSCRGYFSLFMRLGNKCERLKFEIICHLRRVEPIFNSYLFLKSKFRIVGRLNRLIKSLGNN